MTWALEPRYDARKSFYGKAEVEQSGLAYTLYSYGTKVARVYREAGTDRYHIEIYGFYSATTLRHIKEFLRQYAGLGECRQADLEKYLTEEEY